MDSGDPSTVAGHTLKGDGVEGDGQLCDPSTVAGRCAARGNSAEAKRIRYSAMSSRDPWTVVGRGARDLDGVR